MIKFVLNNANNPETLTRMHHYGGERFGSDQLKDLDFSMILMGMFQINKRIAFHNLLVIKPTQENIKERGFRIPFTLDHIATLDQVTRWKVLTKAYLIKFFNPKDDVLNEIEKLDN